MFSLILACAVGLAHGSATPPGGPIVIDRVVSDWYVNATAEFVVNQQDARAWVEATVDNGDAGDEHDSQTLRVKVPDLSYDARTQEVIYSDQRARVVCARLTSSKFLFIRQTRIRETGQCELVARLETRSDDDGFEHTKNKHLVVELTVGRQ